MLILSLLEYLTFLGLLFYICSIGVESEEDEEDMNVDASKQPADIEQALGAASALGKLSIKKAGGSELVDVTDGLDELNMDDYDDEDDGI